MFQKLVRGIFQRQLTFEPLYSLEQLSAIAQMPVAIVFPFTPLRLSSAGENAGPGVGAALANLLRRGLLLTRRLSVLDAGDSGPFADPDYDVAADQEVLASAFEAARVLVQGTLLEDANGMAIRLDVIQQGSDGPQARRMQLRFKREQVGQLSGAVTRNVCKLIGVACTEELSSRLRTAQPRDWKELCQTGYCLEQGHWAKLIERTETGVSHPDALSAVDSEGISPELSYRGDAAATRLDPWNPQAFFNLATSLMKVGPAAQMGQPAMSALRHALTIAPGHGKAHMCLPHVIPHVAEYRDYILGHADVGYRLLRTNSFALGNFSQYLCMFAPDDPRILELHQRSIQLSPLDPGGYSAAVQHFVMQGAVYDAMQFAQQLLRICTPPLHERTIYAFRQDPEIARLMDQGEFDPVAFAQSHVQACLEPRRTR